MLTGLLNGDMACVYQLMGHDGDFAHGTYKCLYCLYNFKTREPGPLCNIDDFFTLSDTHLQNRGAPALTFDIVNRPVFRCPLNRIVPFFLHVDLGLFLYTIKALCRECRVIDRLIPVADRNPEALEVLEQELELCQQHIRNATVELGIVQARKVNVSEVLEEKAALLVGIHPTWWYQNSVRMVQRKYQQCVDRDTRVEQFVQQQ